MIFSKINRLASKILGFFYLLIKANCWLLVRYYNKKSINVVWIKINPFFNFFDYLKYNDLLADTSLIYALVKNGIEYRIVIGSKIGKTSDCKIFYSISETGNYYNLSNYSNSLGFIVRELENQGNQVFPKTHEVMLWENKGYMQEMFKSLNISHPKTVLVNRDYTENEFEHIEYPILVKEIHSAGSRGVKKVNDEIELLKQISIAFNKGHNKVILQQLIDMRKDLRVIVLRDEIILYYWRVNPTSEWKPTATSFGNNTEFGNFPLKWNNYFIDSLKKLDLISGAFDVTWQNDDLNTMPLILEVSPSYQPNPLLPHQFKNIPFKKYKKKLFIKNPYYKEYIDIVLNIKLKVISAYLNS